MFAAALAMAMTCPKKRRLDLEPHAAAKTTTSNHFFLLRGCGDIMKNSGSFSQMRQRRFLWRCGGVTSVGQMSHLAASIREKK
jgi:hypothetical protein